MEIEAAAIGGDHLAHQKCAAIAELRGEAAELVARIGLRHGIGPFGQAVARKYHGPIRLQGVGIKAKRGRQAAVEDQQARGRCRGRLHGQKGSGQVADP